MEEPINIFWFRRDVRIDDNAGLAHALAGDLPVQPIFIFDDDILSKLEDRDDARVQFIRDSVEALDRVFRENGSFLRVERGRPAEVFRRLLASYKIKTVYACGDYEPYAGARDRAVADLLREHGASLTLVKDQVVFEKLETCKDDGKPYTVFTPYSRKWKAALVERSTAAHPSAKNLRKLRKIQRSDKAFSTPSLGELGFKKSGVEIPKPSVENRLISEYQERRNFPAMAGTSRLGLHLRFGTVSPRGMVRLALKIGAKGETWLSELIWREFFMQILWNFPHVVDGPFRKEYAAIAWRQDEEGFQRWQLGQTGYPIVDAGMRELAQTGFMHNRVRMITASFLCKHLLIDWRWGEAWFARKLLDFDLSANNGNWQWAAGCGCDAAPYFRVFNPTLQAKKFDPEGDYVKLWVPEYGSSTYPQPMVDHAMARARALAAYSQGLGRKAPAPSQTLE